MATKLPIFELKINSADSGVDFIALVDEPAIERYFLQFSSTPNVIGFAADVERRILTGPAMIPDKPIFRSDDGTHGEHYVFFSKETIESIAVKFFREHSPNNVNLQHGSQVIAQGVTIYESFISDTSRGILPPAAFKELPEGTWFTSFKVDNDKIWNDYVKSGIFKGFSVEGLFDYMDDQEDEAMRLEQEIDELLKLIEK